MITEGIFAFFLNGLLSWKVLAESPSKKYVKDFPVSQWIRYQLQERQRTSFRQKAPSPVVKHKKFSFYKDFPLSGGMLNRLEDRKNLLYGGHFNPERTYLLEQKITKPFLRQRGIKEVIGAGVSFFPGSSKARRHNILETIKRFDGYIIPKGEIFSFNSLLGEVSEETGYKWERVIRDGKDVWGLGGGVCQVSSTIYRAALNAGLPIVERRNHSYILDYYKPPGLDATVYPGHQDLVFKNDTPGDILMRLKVRGDTLFVIFFGTKDARRVQLLSRGYWENDVGGRAVYWDRIIRFPGHTKTERITSTYRPNPNQVVARRQSDKKDSRAENPAE